MEEQVLISQTGNITESYTTGDCVRPGCLGQLKGPIADWNDPTRNRRYYSRELWVKVFDTDWVQEAIETHTLFGEADHPEERIEPLLTKAAVVLVDYRFADEEKTIYGTFDILDTPSGRILRTLADYGCELGVSSRGRGQLVSRNGRQEVDPDSYVFGGFDVVALPAVKKARQVFIKESDAKDLRLDIADQIERCRSESDLRLIKSVLDRANLSDIKDIDNLIESRMSEFYDSTEDDTIIRGLTRDLREACDQISDLKVQLEKVNANGRTDTIGESEVMGRLRGILVENGMTDTISDGQVVDRISEIVTTRNRRTARRERQRSKEMEAKLADDRELIESMSGELESNRRDVDNLNEVVNELRKALDESKAELSERTEELRLAREELAGVNNELNSVIAEYDEVVDDYNSTLAANRELIERYLGEQAIKLGISRNDLVRLLPEGYGVREIDDLVDSQMNLRRKISKLPMTRGDIGYGDPVNESLTRTFGGPSTMVGEYPGSSMANTEKILLSMKKDRYNHEPATNS